MTEEAFEKADSTKEGVGAYERRRAWAKALDAASRELVCAVQSCGRVQRAGTVAADLLHSLDIGDPVVIARGIRDILDVEASSNSF